jgi:hypothetical protein
MQSACLPERDWKGRQRIDGCAICGKSFYREVQSRYCFPCAEVARKTKQSAYRKVKRAIERGELPEIHTQYCVDCGAFARYYEHRDYSKPLDVVPVCQSCNMKRGPGAYPKKLRQSA